MSTSPVAWEQVEDAIATWVQQSTGATTYFVEPEDSGAPEPAPPRAQIRHLTLVKLADPDVRKIPSIVLQRYTVTGPGPGTVGVNLYTGVGTAAALEPQVISVAVGAVDEETAALALLAELDADLPAGITATIDPEDAASVLIEGSESLPHYAAAGIGLTSVETIRERFPELEADLSRWTWRVSMFAANTRGFATASDLQARAVKAMTRVLGPLVRAAGWNLSGILADLNNLPTDRNESRAVLDFALVGYATAFFQDPAARAIGLDTS